MNIKEFEELVDLHGEDLSEWPQALRVPAMRLLERSGDARKIIDSASRLRELLDISSSTRAPAGLADRIVMRAAMLAETDSARSDRIFYPRPWYAWIERQSLRPALLLSCLVCGVAVGIFTAPREEIRPIVATSTVFADLVQ